MRTPNKWLLEIAEDRAIGTCLIRVDGGRIPGLSFGHLNRCLTLSASLKKAFGTQCRFLMKNIPDGVEYARKSNQIVNTFPEDYSIESEDKLIVDHAEEICADLVIVDLPYKELNISCFQQLKRKQIKSMFIDDSRFINPGADIYMNTSILATKNFDMSTASDTKLLLGPQFFIFDNTLTTTKIELDKDKKNIVLSFGGSDPKDLTGHAVKILLKQKWENTVFRIILGPGYGNAKAIIKSISGREHSFKIIDAPKNIIPYFIKADLVICAGGRTMYELIYLNCKFLPIGSIEWETDAIKQFVKEGLVEMAIPLWSSTQFRTALDTLKMVGYH